MMNLNLQLFLYLYCYVFIELCLIFTEFFTDGWNDETFLREDTVVAVRISETKRRNCRESNRQVHLEKGSIVLFEHQSLSDLQIYVKFQRIFANFVQYQPIKPSQLCAVVGAVDPANHLYYIYCWRS